MNTNGRNRKNIGDELLYRDEVYAIVGAAMEVHNTLGPGFLESVYQEALEIELTARKIPFQSQVRLPLRYKDIQMAQVFIADMLVDGKVIVELKAVDQLIGAHEAELLNYLKATGLRVGLLLNFGNARLEHPRFAL